MRRGSKLAWSSVRHSWQIIEIFPLGFDGESYCDSDMQPAVRKNPSGGGGGGWGAGGGAEFFRNLLALGGSPNSSALSGDSKRHLIVVGD